MATVIVADWSPVGGADRTWIEYGADTTYGATAPERDPGEAVVLGCHPDTEVHLRLAAQSGDEVVYSDDVTVTTGSLPSGLPTLAADVDTGADFGDWLLTSLTAMVNTGGGGGGGGAASGTASVVLFDRTGQIVWYTEPQGGFLPAARPSRDGRAILYLWDATVASTDEARICRADLSGESTTCLATPGATHDFVELPDGSYAYGKDDVRAWETYTLTGNSLVQMSQDGVETELWNLWDELAPVPQDSWSGRTGVIDWSHFNGMWYDDASATFYLSFLLLEEVRKVPAATGATEWVIGGADNQFTFDGVEFGPQHAPQLVDGGLLLFDNGTQPAPSRLAAYALDEAAHTATETLSVPHPDGAHAVVMGDAHLLPNGHIASSYGDTGDLFVFSGAGELEWSMYPENGTMPGQVYVYDDIYALAPN